MFFITLKYIILANQLIFIDKQKKNRAFNLAQGQAGFSAKFSKKKVRKM